MTTVKVQILPQGKPSRSSSSPSSSDDHKSNQSSDSHGPAIKKTRARTAKTRSGCVTCKIRRIKCDEGKPECNRCTSTGRKCDGYVIKPRKKRSRPGQRTQDVDDAQKDASEECPTLKPVPCLDLALSANPAELRLLGFYHYKTAPALSSYFDSEFWLRLVFQMSQREPAVMHAMVALGALHEQRELSISNASEQPVIVRALSDVDSSLEPHNEGLTEEFALIQYGKAITHLSTRLNSESSIELALLTCILFVCVEFLRGDAKQAVCHFRNGMNIAKSALATKESSGANADTLQRIREIVFAFLNRIELLSVLDGLDINWPYPVELVEAVPETFKTLREARDSLIHLANLSVRFITSFKDRKYEQIILPDDLYRQAALIRQLEAWEDTLESVLLTRELSRKDMDAAKTLRMHEIIARLWLKRCMYAEEATYDASFEDYETAVSLAESVHCVGNNIIRRNSTTTVNNSNDATFLFDMEIVSPLFFVGKSCRHPQIRRRAIAVLKQTHRREGLWDSHLAATAAERVMHYEEKNLTVFDGRELPAERDRLHQVFIEAEMGTNPKKYIMTFRSAPKGFSQPMDWLVWKEQITLP